MLHTVGPLRVELRVVEETAILTLRGRLDFPLDRGLLRTMERLMDEGFKQVVADCRSLEYLSSRGISTLLAVTDDLRDRGGDLKIVSTSLKVTHLLERLGLVQILEHFDTLDGAVRAFEAPSGDSLDVDAPEEFISSPHSSLYHAAGCPAAHRIRHRQTYSTKNSARRAGKKPCGRCLATGRR